MRKRLVGFGVGLLLLVVGLSGVLAFLVRPPKIEVPPRHYPPNNAYDLYRKLGTEIREKSQANPQIAAIEKKLSTREALSPTERKLYLEFMEPYLREYRKHLGKPCVAVFEYDINWLFPELAGFRQIARAEAYLVREDLRNGRERSAVERFDSLLRFSNQIRNEGGLIHYLVGVALTNIGLAPLWETSPQSKEALEALVKTAQWYEEKRVLPVKTVRAERNFGLSIYRDLAANKIRVEDIDNKGEPARSSWGRSGAFAKLILRLMVRTALPEYQRYMDMLEQQIQLPHWQREKQIPEPRHSLNAIILPIYAPAMGVDAEEQARVRLTGVMSAIRLYKLRNGHYPKDLEVLNLGELIIDPFSGKPFVYRTDPRKGFMLYSVGRNGVDDGGAFPYGGARAETGDLVPAYRPVPANLENVEPENRPLHPPVWFR